MAFVRGHARATGWVMAHVRAPNRAGEGQLALLPAVLPPLAERIPRQRRSSSRATPAATHST
jgi:hypothetical protein